MIGQLWIVAVIPVAVLGVVFALFLHELAHVVPILLAGHVAQITIGNDAGRTVGLGPLSVTVGYDGLVKLTQFGYYQPEGDPSRRIEAIAALAGPLATFLLVASLGVALYRGVAEPLVFVTSTVVLSEINRLYQTAVPKTYSRGPYAGWDSDGKRFLQLVRS